MDEYRNILSEVDRLCRYRQIPMPISLVEEVKKVYEKGLSLEIDSQETPLMLASDWRYDDLVWGFIQCAKQTNTNLQTGGTLDLQEFLGYRNSSGQTALHVAVKRPADDVIRVLLKEVSVEHLISYRDKSGMTPISLLERDDRYHQQILEVMEAAASKGDHQVDPTTTHDKQQGFVPVYTEIEMDPNSRPTSHINETRESLKKLDDGKLELTENKSTILHRVSELGDTAYAKDILKRHPSLIHNRNIKGETPFYVAASERQIEVLEILISYAKSDKIEELATRSTDKDTALHIAIKKHHVGVVFWLVKRIPQLANHVNDLNESPLYLAADKMFYAIVELIVKECKEKAYDGPDRKTALHAAVISEYESHDRFNEMKRERCIRCLLQANIGFLQIQDEDGWRTPLHYAAIFGRSDIIRNLLENRSDYIGNQMATAADDIITSAFHIPDKNGRNMLHVAIEYERSYIIALICEDESLINSLVNQKDGNGDTPLHLLVASSNLERILLANIGLLKIQDENGRTPWHYAAKLGRSDMIRGLLEKRTKYEHIGRQMTTDDIGITDTNGRNMLHVAIGCKKIAIIKLILEDESLTSLISQKDGNGNTPLHLLMASSDLEMIEGTLQANIALLKIQDKDGWTPLHYAAKLGRSDVIQKLLENRTADGIITSAFEIIDTNGRNMLHVAIEYKQVDIIKFIFKNESLTSIINQKDGNGDTPLHLLMASSDLEMKGIVIDARFDIHVLNNKCRTPLDMASSEEKRETLKEAMAILEGEHGKPRRRLWEVLEKEIKEKKKKQVFTRIGDNVVLVVTLIATATFAAAFTVPGGFDGNEGPDQGMPILLKKAAYKVFVVANALAFSCSCTVLFVYIRLQLRLPGKEEKDGSINMICLQYLLTGIAMVAMAIAFVTGTYVTLTPSLGFAIPVCAMCLCIMVPLSIFPGKRLGFVTAILSKLV